MGTKRRNLLDHLFISNLLRTWLNIIISLRVSNWIKIGIHNPFGIWNSISFFLSLPFVYLLL